MDKFNGTIATMTIDEDDVIIYKCEEHAGNREVCLMVSTISNLLICECLAHSIQPIEYGLGIVHLEIKHPTDAQKEVFTAAFYMLDAISKSFPEHFMLREELL